MTSKSGKRGLLLTSVATGLAGAVGFAGPALAQGGNEIVVTGTFIAGTAETAALPVDVIGADELQRQGNPTVVDMIKNLSVSSGVIGDQNQFAGNSVAPQSPGTATVNLRGLSPQRTLVLLNGRRLALHPTRNGPVDLNTLPQAAIGRIEVLKDGAAATYGSDAIAGVVNFITRKNFDGLQLSGETRHVPEAENPDYSASVLWGWQGDRGDILLSGGWQYRGRLRVNAVDFNDRPYWVNPDSGFSFTNNPTSFQPLIGGTYNAPTLANPAGTWTGGTVGSQVRDPGCATVGAIASFTAGAQTCQARIAGTFANIIDPTKRFQLYGESNYDISDNVTFHAEALFSQTYAVQRSSPAYPSTLNTPSNVTTPIGSSATGSFNAGSIIGSYFTPVANPGLALLMSQFPAAFPAGTTGVRWASGLNFRALGLGGNPIMDTEGLGPDGSFSESITDAWRVSAGLTGKVFNDAIGWDVNSTYSVTRFRQKAEAEVLDRIQYALRGYGNLASNPNACNATTTNNFTTNAGNAAVGCYWLNPFSNSFAVNAPSGVTGSQFPGRANPLYSPTVANNPDMIEWIWDRNDTDAYSRLFVMDAVLNGELPIELGDGKIGWAAGAQFRRSTYNTDYADTNDLSVNPCIDTIVNGSKNCNGTSPTGIFVLQSGLNATTIAQNVWAAFVEFNLPISETIGAHLAARFEDYGESGGGSTFNPKFDIRWQALDWLAFRGSAGTTFRAPPLTLLDPAPVVTGTFLANAYRATSLAGNATLQPETATTYTIGGIIQAGGFKATIDYWNFDLKDPFVAEPAGTFFNVMFPNNTNVNCNNPAFATLQARFAFGPTGVCALDNVTLVNLSYINQGGTKTDGVDVAADYTFNDFLSEGSALTVGSSLTWLNKYEVEAQVVQGATLAPAFDAAGKLNYNTGYASLPQWKGDAHIEWETGPHNVRLQVNYIDGYFDQRTTPFTGNLVYIDPTSGATITTPRSTEGRNIKEFVTADITYRVLLPWETTAVLNVSNIMDTDPPLVRQEMNYDASVASGVGRTVKVALTKKF